MDAPTFVDECLVHVRGGDGGNGAVSFRREAHVPRGGPDGGDGGSGGSVVLVADPNVGSLLDLRRAPHLRASRGGHGSGMGRTGADGDDRIVRVPLGTLVRDAESGAVRADLVSDGQRFVAGRGGRGGRGNLAFANRHRRLPGFAERGERVVEHRLRLELKVIADVGLVGYPSAGKSSLVRRLSSATPRVEAWPFTTLTPHLGVMRGGDGPSGVPVDVVIADVPGLIEGAAEGRGLGTRFLRHVERCSVLLHVLDCLPMETERDPVRDLARLRHELVRHDPALARRRELVVLNKVDLPDGRAMAELALPELEAAGEEVLVISALTGEGIDALRYRLAAIVLEEREAGGTRAPRAAAPTEVVLRPRPSGIDLTVERVEGSYVVRGERIERWVAMLPLDDHGALRYLQGRLRRAGVERALVEAGARRGDDVVIGDVVFSFEPELDDLPAEERELVAAGESDPIDEDEA
ncbi:MAG: GTPase ObgE [Actinomycetota bacterium]